MLDLLYLDFKFLDPGVKRCDCATIRGDFVLYVCNTSAYLATNCGSIFDFEIEKGEKNNGYRGCNGNTNWRAPPCVVFCLKLLSWFGRRIRTVERCSGGFGDFGP